MCVFLLDTDGRITAAGSGWAAVAGSADSAPIGRSLMEFVAPDFMSHYRDAFSRARTGSVQVVDFRAAFQQKLMWRATLAPVSTDSGTAVAAFLSRLPEDGTHRDALIGRAVRSIAHDLNNVLTVIVGLNGLMTGTDKVRQALYTTEIGKAAEKATQLSAELLTVGRRHNQDTGVIGINAILLDLEPMLRRLVTSNIELTVVRGQGVAPIRANRAVVETMVIDLVVNAIRALAGGGRLILQSYQHDGCTALAVSEDGGRDTDASLLAAVRASAIACDALTTDSVRPGIGSNFQIFFPVARRA